MNSSKVATKGAKRHHIVPRMLLRRFTIDPAADNPELWGLDISSGRPFASSVNNEAVIRHYYRIDEPNLPIGPNQAEEWLSRIESDAAVPIRKLVAGISLSQRERDSMALFLHVTQRRTPQSRAWHAYLDEQMHVEMLKFKLSNPDYIRQVYKGQPGFDTDDGIEAWRIQTLADLESGRLGIESGQNREVAYIFLSYRIGICVLRQPTEHLRRGCADSRTRACRGRLGVFAVGSSHNATRSVCLLARHAGSTAMASDRHRRWHGCRDQPAHLRCR